MTGSNRMLLSLFHDYCNALWARTDITYTTKWEQAVKFGYGIQWAVTGNFAINDQGWVQRVLESWGFPMHETVGTHGHSMV